MRDEVEAALMVEPITGINSDIEVSSKEVAIQVAKIRCGRVVSVDGRWQVTIPPSNAVGVIYGLQERLRDKEQTIQKVRAQFNLLKKVVNAMLKVLDKARGD